MHLCMKQYTWTLRDKLSFLFCVSVQKHSYLFEQYSETHFPCLLMTFCCKLQKMILYFDFYFTLDLETIDMK